MNAAERLRAEAHQLESTGWADDKPRWEAFRTGAAAIEKVASLEEALRAIQNHLTYEDWKVAMDLAESALAPADARGEKGGADG